MTEKDAARCHKIEQKNMWALKIEADLPEEFINQIMNKVKSK